MINKGLDSISLEYTKSEQWIPGQLSLFWISFYLYKSWTWKSSKHLLAGKFLYLLSACSLCVTCPVKSRSSHDSMTRKGETVNFMFSLLCCIDFLLILGPVSSNFDQFHKMIMRKLKCITEPNMAIWQKSKLRHRRFRLY